MIVKLENESKADNLSMAISIWFGGSHKQTCEQIFILFPNAGLWLLLFSVAAIKSRFAGWLQINWGRHLIQFIPKSPDHDRQQITICR